MLNKTHLARPNAMARSRIDYFETEIRHRVEEAGGRWNPVQKLWELLLSTIFDLDLED